MFSLNGIQREENGTLLEPSESFKTGPREVVKFMLISGAGAVFVCADVRKMGGIR